MVVGKFEVLLEWLYRCPRDPICWVVYWLGACWERVAVWECLEERDRCSALVAITKEASHELVLDSWLSLGFVGVGRASRWSLAPSAWRLW